MFWEDCNKPSFHKHICKPKSLMYLDVKNVIYSHVAKIVWNYMEEDKQKFNKIKTDACQQHEKISVCLF